MILVEKGYFQQRATKINFDKYIYLQRRMFEYGVTGNLPPLRKWLDMITSLTIAFEYDT